ncbi:MAG: hypothetical protein Q4P25_01875 [Tissierellia bacterium]|nr:hypothetical protein [Tissierellia bacterium]
MRDIIVHHFALNSSVNAFADSTEAPQIVDYLNLESFPSAAFPFHINFVAKIERIIGIFGSLSLYLKPLSTTF